MASLVPELLAGTGTHALVIGVSRYRHLPDSDAPTARTAELGLEQLTAAARSASEFASWLLTEYSCPWAPLSSLRVLLSPSEGEQIAPAIAALLGASDAEPTRANVTAALGEFRAACDSHTANVSIVYVAGHGVQLSKHGAIVLLSDVGANDHHRLLEGAIDMAGVHAGMNHPATAQTQFWFVDACRQRPMIAKRFESMGGAISLDEPIGEAETSPLFLAATTGSSAYAVPGGLTLFAEALLWTLRGGGAVGPSGDGTEDGIEAWHVPVTQLISRLPARVRAIASQLHADQSVDIAGKVNEATMHVFAAAPTVDLRINVDPDAARLVSRLTLSRPDPEPFAIENVTVWPFEQQVTAGLYNLLIDTEPPFRRQQAILNVRPPSMSKAFTVS